MIKHYIFSIIVVIFLFSKIYSDSSVIFLCYHTFHVTSKSPYNIPPDTLKEQLDVMIELGYRFVSFDDIENGTIEGHNNICITIDDGSITVEKVYNEIFIPYNIKPLLFIYPARIGKESRALTDEQLKALLSQGIRMGGHGYHHLKIDEKLFKEDTVAFTKEIVRGKSFLEEKTGVKTTIFAYPFGIVCKESVALVQKSGYSYAFTINYGEVKIPLSENKNPYRLPRYMITNDSWPYVSSILKKRSLKFHADTAKK